VPTKKLCGHFSSGGDVPRQQFADAPDGVVGDAREHVAQAALRIQTVQFRRADQAVDCGGALATRIRACEKVILAAQGNDAQRTIRGVVVDCYFLALKPMGPEWITPLTLPDARRRPCAFGFPRAGARPHAREPQFHSLPESRPESA